MNRANASMDSAPHSMIELKVLPPAPEPRLSVSATTGGDGDAHSASTQQLLDSDASLCARLRRAPSKGPPLFVGVILAMIVTNAMWAKHCDERDACAPPPPPSFSAPLAIASCPCNRSVTFLPRDKRGDASQRVNWTRRFFNSERARLCCLCVVWFAITRALGPWALADSRPAHVEIGAAQTILPGTVACLTEFGWFHGDDRALAWNVTNVWNAHTEPGKPGERAHFTVCFQNKTRNETHCTDNFDKFRFDMGECA